MKADRAAKVEDLSLSQRLVLVKRLMGLRMARITVFMGDDDSIHIGGVVRDDDPSMARDSDDAGDLDERGEVPVLRVGSVSYRIPELLDREDVRLGDYFG